MIIAGMLKNEDGFIDRVYSNLGNDDQRYCKIRTRKDKLPEIGDKFASGGQRYNRYAITF